MSWSILLGGTLCWIGAAPYLYENCLIIAKGYPCPGYDDPAVPRLTPSSGVLRVRYLLADEHSSLFTHVLHPGRIRNDFGIWVGVATLLAAAFTDLAFNYKSVLGGLRDSFRVVGMAARSNDGSEGARCGLSTMVRGLEFLTHIDIIFLVAAVS